MDASALASAEYWLSVIASAKLVAAFLVAIGVAIEFGGDWISRPFEKTVAEAREMQLAALQHEAEDARAQIAAANARANEAAQAAERERTERLKLEAQVAPRRLTLEQENAIAAALREFSGRPVKVITYSLDADGGVLGGQIIDALKAAGMEVFNGIASSMPVGSFIMGITVDGPDRAFCEAIAHAFWSIGNLQIGAATAGGAQANRPLTIITVGVKPIR